MTAFNVADALKLGSTDVDKVYLGADEIWVPSSTADPMGTFVTAGTLGTGVSGDAVHPLLAGTQLGDLMVAVTVGFYADDAPTIHSGWTLRGQISNTLGSPYPADLNFYSKYADATDIANMTVNVTYLTPGDSGIIGCAVYRGLPVIESVSGVRSKAHTSLSYPSVGGLNFSKAGRMLLLIGGEGSVLGAWAAGVTDRGRGRTYPWWAIADVEVPAAGNSPLKTASMTSGTSWGGLAIAATM